MSSYDVALDYMDMTDDRRIWVRSVDVRDGLDLEVGQHVIVGDDDADSSVAKVVAFDRDLIQLEVLPGDVASHRHLLST